MTASLRCYTGHYEYAMTRSTNAEHSTMRSTIPSCVIKSCMPLYCSPVKHGIALHTEMQWQKNKINRSLKFPKTPVSRPPGRAMWYQLQRLGTTLQCYVVFVTDGLLMVISHIFHVNNRRGAWCLSPGSRMGYPAWSGYASSALCYSCGRQRRMFVNQSGKFLSECGVLMVNNAVFIEKIFT